MKCTIPEISWHNRDPVLSIDIQPKFEDKNEFYRLATGGTDSHVLIWHLISNEDSRIKPEIAADLSRHQKAVNTVRWSPSGEYLASGDDESVIFIWKLKSESETINILDTTNEQDKEIWITFKILRGHMEDVYDLAWSPDSRNLISASVDNTAMVWDVLKGKSQCILSDHKNFVQGVAWDPKNKYLVTISTDRNMRTYDVNTKKMISKSGKSILPVPCDSPLNGKVIRLFHDETLQTFYRRLCFSPDGQLIIAPSGVAELHGENSKPIHTTYIYTRFDQKTPSVVLPSPDQFTIAARCCPLLFELREYDESNPPIIDLPYRMVFAVATKSSVCLYDTQQKMPFGLISNIHYARLTDLAWSSDGKVLVVSSSDGFCTLITFSDDELGTVYAEKQDLSDTSMDIQGDHHSSVNSGNLNTSVASQKSAQSDTKPTPIAFRHTPRVVSEFGGFVTPNLKITPTKDKILAVPPNIIRIDDKFEVPDQKNKIATPISVRRQPRTLNNNSPVQNNGNISEQNDENCFTTPLKSIDQQNTSTSNAKKKPTPIAVRRQPRIILQKSASPVEQCSTEDDALDAWPIDQPKPIETNTSDTSKTVKLCDEPERNEQLITTKFPDTIDMNLTEDIRLIYEDDSQESSIEDAVVTPNSKAPRRVELRTISTPKSTKKLF